MDQAQKQFYVKTDHTFQTGCDWLIEEKRNNGLIETGYHEMRLTYVRGNAGEDPDSRIWHRPHDFTRTCHATVRLMMLEVTGMRQLCDPKIRQPARGRNKARFDRIQPQPQFSRPANAEYKLARNRYEAQWVVGHYDMLFPHYYLESVLQPNGELIGVDAPTNIPTREMIILDIVHHVAWHFVVSLHVTRRVDIDKYKQFEAVPNTIVIRMDYLNRPPGWAPNYPFQPPPPPPPPPHDDDEEIDRMIPDFLHAMRF